MRKKPRMVVLSPKVFKKRTGLKSGGYAKGNTVFYTKDTTPFVIEHEKAHIKLGHQPTRLTAPQFVRRELKADKIASQKTNLRYPKSYLRDIVNDTANRFDLTKKDSNKLVRKEARNLKLI